MLANRVRMGSGKDSFNGVLYQDGAGANLWRVNKPATEGNPYYSKATKEYDHLYLQTVASFMDGFYVSFITTKTIDLTKAQTITIKGTSFMNYGTYTISILDAAQSTVQERSGYDRVINITLDVSNLNGGHYIEIMLGGTAGTDELRIYRVIVE